MNGARDLYNVFKKPEQIGRLYVLPGSHARGKTFHIYVLPKDEEADIRYATNPPCNKDAVEVYGIVGGNPGWTEHYGWLHFGKWEDDFLNIFLNRKTKQEAKARNVERSKAEETVIKHDRLTSLLSNYD